MKQNISRIPLVFLLAALLLAGCGTESTRSYPQGWLPSFGIPADAPGYFAGAVGLAVDASGNLYVAEERNRRIQVLDPEHRPVRDIPAPGFAPLGVDVAPNGDVLVVGQHQVARLTPEGGERGRWPVDGEQYYMDVAAGPGGAIAVSGNGSLVLIRDDGSTRTWDVPWAGGVDFDAAGRIHVTGWDEETRINVRYVFDPGGDLVRSDVVPNPTGNWGYRLQIDGDGNDVVVFPNHLIALAPDGNVLGEPITTPSSPRDVAFRDGEAVLALGSRVVGGVLGENEFQDAWALGDRKAPGTFSGARDVAAFRSGSKIRVAVADVGNHRVQVLDGDGTPVEVLERTYPSAVGFAPDGALWVGSLNEARQYRGTSLEGVWTLFEVQPGVGYVPAKSIAFDGESAYFLVQGSVVTRLTGSEVEEVVDYRGERRAIESFAVLPSGEIVVASGSDVNRYSPDGEFLGSFRKHVPYLDMTVRSDTGTILVTTPHDFREIDLEGNELQNVFLPAKSVGVAIAVDEEGTVSLLDAQRDVVLRYQL